MSIDRDTTRTVRAWLRTEEHETADHVLFAVLDQLDTTPQRRLRWLPAQRPALRAIAGFGLGAAAVVAAVVIGMSLAGRNIGEPVPPAPAATSTATPTVAPTPTPTPMTFGGLPATGAVTGTNTITAPFPIDVTFTVEEPWTMWSPGAAVDAAAIYQGSPDPPSGRGIVFAIVANVYADPCDTRAGALIPPVGPSVDDLASALLAQVNTEGGPPVPVTVDGYQGVYLEFTNTNQDDPTCIPVKRWNSTPGPREALVGERDQIWILDVDGVRLVIDLFSFPGTSEADIAEMRAIVDTIDIEVRPSE